MKNILINTEMINSILDGRKTQFREVCTQPIRSIVDGHIRVGHGLIAHGSVQHFIEQKSKYQTGETIWKDTDYESKIIGVRVERLQDITFEDISKEVGHKKVKDSWGQHKQNCIFTELWDKTAPKGYKWENNPYVFVYEFERVQND